MRPENSEVLSIAQLCAGQRQDIKRYKQDRYGEKMKVAIFTLGCKVNQFESQAIGQELTARGHELTDFDSSADAYIINTCTVTATSDKKSRHAVRRARSLNANAIVAVCGCYVQVSPDETEKLGVDLLCGTSDRIGFVTLLEQAVTDKKQQVCIPDIMKNRAFEPLAPGGLAGRTRALLKIQDGCANFCSYCIIPYARGPVRSLALSQVKSQAARLDGEGYREIVLTGIEISSYGQDFKDGTDLCDAVEAVCLGAPHARVRLGSLEPRTVTEAFCQRLSKLKNLCGHFHLSLQSGCDETLRRMNRKYDTARYFESVTLLRRYFSGCAVACDLIAGFPGETPQEFEQTCAFAEKCEFAFMHIFPYSRRRGTPAALMENQVPRGEKHSRAARLSFIADKASQSYRTDCVGKTLFVLFEREEAGACAGHAENYVEVSAPGTGLRGQILPVRILSVSKDGLLGEIADKP